MGKKGKLKYKHPDLPFYFELYQNSNTLLKHFDSLFCIYIFVIRVRRLGSNSLKVRHLVITAFAHAQTFDNCVGGYVPLRALLFSKYFKSVQVFLVSASQISVVRKNMFPQWRTLLDSAQSVTLFARILQSDWHCMLPSEKTTREQQKEKNLCSRFQRPYFSNDLQN